MREERGFRDLKRNKEIVEGAIKHGVNYLNKHIYFIQMATSIRERCCFTKDKEKGINAPLLQDSEKENCCCCNKKIYTK